MIQYLAKTIDILFIFLSVRTLLGTEQVGEARNALRKIRYWLKSRDSPWVRGKWLALNRGGGILRIG